MSIDRKVHRRGFLKVAAGAAAAPMFLPASARGANDRIVMGGIGMGSRGTSNMRNLLNHGVAFAAVADPDAGHAARAKKIIEDHGSGNRAGKAGRPRGCETYNDYREVLGRDDIDAVMIGTPDHWHGPVVIEAARAGKDMYCEKPLSLTIGEGRAMVDAVERYGRVFQTGSQQRSDSRFRFACELVRNGRIGRLVEMEVGLPTGPETDEYRYGPVPEGFDHDLWLGPAPERPYTPIGTHGSFRWLYDYSGGQVTDWGAHHCDIAQWGNGTMHTGPVAVEGEVEAEFPKGGLWDTPIHYRFVATYKDGARMIASDAYERGVRFVGEDGWVFVTRGRIEADPPGLLSETFAPDEVHLYRSGDHYQNFLDCVRSRRETVAPIENGHRSVSIAHLGNIAMRLGRGLRWDPAAERFVDDPAADRMLDRAGREPWAV